MVLMALFNALAAALKSRQYLIPVPVLSDMQNRMGTRR